MPPRTNGILETCLYVEDLARSVRFYEQVFGFAKVEESERGCAMHVGEGRLLLLFKKGASPDIATPHDASGELHVAFAVPASELAAWESWLAQSGIEIEQKKAWDRGGQSIYFRDPDRHILELATPGTWPVY